MSDQPTNLPTSVALRIIETTPAVVKFNYEEMEANLDAVLVKYQGLTFTNSDAAECKKTIVELRKGQKALSDFRIKTKKELTESVTDFEKQCKKLHDKFETVISPLTTQNDQFELDLREKKRVEIQIIIDALVTEKALNEKYVARLVILEEYFNKGKALKAIKTELSTLATSLKVQQDKEAQDEDLIKTKVELANAQYQLSNTLTPDTYVRFLQFHSVANIEAMIIGDAQQTSELEKKAAEALAAKTDEVPKAEEIVSSPAPVQIPSAENVVNNDVTPSRSTITAIYEVTGTDDQLAELEAYLSEFSEANNFSWKINEKSLDVDPDDDDDFMN